MELKNYSGHGQMSSDYLKIRAQANYAIALNERIEKLEALLQQLLDAEGVIRNSHNRKIVKAVLAEK